MLDAAIVSGAVATESPSGATPRGQSPQLWSSLRAIVEAQLGSPVPGEQHASQSGHPDGAAATGRRDVQVLDCGGGSGSLAVPLATLGASVTVVDVSIDALGILLRRAAEAGVSDRVTAVQGEAESLTTLLPAATFDLVLAHGVLQNVSQLPGAVAELAAMTRPGGLVSIVVANPVAAVIGRALAGDVAGALATFHRQGTPQLDLASLEVLCGRAGLSVQRVDGLGVFSEIVPGIDLERPGALAALAELESAASGLAPYRDIASRLHLVARRPGSGE
jgi:2-polyprenyl-3-methyl-5-hydroxy-6-metoxy-1,4-benzoquinol methylase